ncbi:SdrD B-like domain-containing protein [Portibacter marinus]|uniref:SdrD B-like domain-containing protein n=1 Tax=Portibacter marinus TaxID=2898660 RepID=UPI001F4649FA|nr:SdrD B-like domain-containing protein [Portibacter marinus]
MRITSEFGLKTGNNSLRSALFLALLLLGLQSATGQCNTISGSVIEEGAGEGVANVLVKAFNADGELVEQEMTDFFGAYSFSNLQSDVDYRIEFVHGGNYSPAPSSSGNGTSVQFVSSPNCDVNFSLVDPASYCADNARVALTCFVQGGVGENDNIETLVFTDYNFSLDSEVRKFAMKSQTGSVWGLTWKPSTQELFSAAFIKQYAGLSEHGHGAIFSTNTKTGVTELHARLDQLGQPIGTILTDPDVPEYGAQVGKMGLGGIEISENGETLYVINIYNNTLVSLSSTNPTTSTTRAFQVPDPGCKGADLYKAFALTRSGNKLYVGTTCTAFQQKDKGEVKVTVFEFDLTTEQFSEIFSSDYPRGFWRDTPADSRKTQHWLTDLAITDEGNMILSLSDRIAHRYHSVVTQGRLDDQHPDILLAWNDNGTWRLENNAQAGPLTGSHPNAANGEGPGGGEFFGYDYWISGPEYHSEIATGSVMVLPGDGSVVATVFDPDFDSYTGGLHKYSTSTGEKLGVGIIYEHTNDPQFGKASGLGDMVTICGDLPLEIGNLLWVDTDNDGIQDAGEPHMPNVDLKLYNEQCEEVGSTTTAANGNYYFNESNVDLNHDGIFDGPASGAMYYIVVVDEDFNMDSGILTTESTSYTLAKADVGFGTQPDINDSDATISDACEVFEGKPAIKVTTGSADESDHTFDIGFTPAGGFDLALRKELISAYAVKYGSVVTYKITVFNQGGIAADEVIVNDYLTEAYTFDPGQNPGWKLDDGIAQTLLGEPLTPGSKHELYIKLIVNEGATTSQLVNYAEIGAAFDADGNPLEDVDSTPDNIVDNDNGGVVGQATDDEINDDGTIDEDDHDPATVGIFDLALRKELTDPGEQVVSNSSVEFKITIFNQGSIAAQSVTISDYLPEDLIFNPDINDGWKLLDDSTVTYLIDESINPLTSRTISLTLETGNLIPGNEIIIYAEISAAVDEYGNENSDVDSTPDGIRDNDNGGNPYDGTDNEINDNGTIDEDDHDPAILNYQLFDLALIKTTISNSVKAGSDVEFEIKVLNQGEIAAKTIGIVDYIPEGMTLNDPEWLMDGEGMAKKEITIPGGLQPGDSITIKVTLKVGEDFFAGTLVNYAEIDHVTGMDDRDLSDSDVDSHPDDERNNDPGGLPGGPTDNQVNGENGEDEDDHDPAFVFVFSSLVNESCICLENATNTEEGQFGELIQIIAPSGLTWYIEQSNGLFDAGFTTMNPPTGDDFAKGSQYPMTEFATGPDGYILPEYPIGGTGNSEYYIFGVRQDGEDYEVVVRNTVGDQEIISDEACNYATNNFEAAEGVCTGALVTYCVDDFDGSAENEWIVDGDAAIVGASDAECVNVQYGNTVGSQVDLVFTSNDESACYSPAMRTVTIGESAGTLSCLSNMNVSLDNNCMLSISPDAILTTPVNVEAVYSVIYTTPQGFMLGNNVDWNNYVDREVVAKVMDNCSGNSCWSTIYVEDKRAPEIECFDLTVSCIEMMEYNGPFVLDNCSEDIILTATGQTQTQLDCDPDYSYILTRSFKAQDEYGNQSDECTQQISVLRPDVDAIVGPEDRTVMNDNALTCNYLDTLENGGELDPFEFGVPMLEGQPIYPSSGEFCNLGVTYKDKVFPTNGCVTKIMRTWLIFEWYCDNVTPDTIIQFINIADMEAPQITCLGDMTVSSNGSTCEGVVNLPQALVSDDCTTDPRVDISYPGGFLENSNGGTILLPLGTHEVTYTVTDDCLNSSSCSITVTVEDRTPPIAICQQHTVLSVRTDGTTYALASSFDDGSYDDCAFGGLEIRRMDGGEACGMDDGGLFGDRVEFCCEDVGEEVMVVLRVYDASGNANQCMVSVHVQDKNPPSIVAPPNLTVDCLEAIDLDDLSRFGEAVATDNCNNTEIQETVFSGLNECRTGIIQRRFIATDGNGTATTSQFITVITEDTFDLDNIIWPQDYFTSAQCDAGSLLPENLPEPNGYPRFIGEGFCTQPAYSYSDKVFDILNSETTCQKIIRSWFVEDFCQFDENGEFMFWRYDQVIEIFNDVPPVLTSTCEDVTICSFNENCETGTVTLSAGASDDCTPGDMMRYAYYIDFDNDGDFDLEDFGAGDTVTVMGEYPLGEHSILFRFSDICGNTVSCRQKFTIENCVEPIVVCHDGLSVGLTAMDLDNDGEFDDEMAIVKARSFDASSYHPCGDSLIYSFTENPADSCRTYDCDSIGMRTVRIYAITPSGQVGFCTTTLDVQDNNDVDICRDVEDCIVMPVDITITECVVDLSPETIGGGPMIDPECICTMTNIEFDDRDSSNVNNSCTTIIRDWTVTFMCGEPMVFTSTQVITIFDNRPPIIECPSSVTVSSSDDSCEGRAELGIPSVLSDCTTEFTITNDSEFADSNEGDASGIYPVGLDTVVYTVTDKCGNIATCAVTVLVTDNADPICDVNDITINVTDTIADITIDPFLIDNGSFDECGMVVDRTITPSVFGCPDAGTVQDVVLTITDESGNTTECMAQVTVRDSVAPICVTRTTNVNLFDDAMVTIPANLINNGSFDLCGELADLEIMNNGFNCERLGTQTVILRITDDSGNFTDCEQDVTVVDRGEPVCILQDITVQLDGNDQAVITGDDIDNGSFDICSGLDSLILDRTSFDCDDIGDVTINVMAVDSAGNTTDCQAVVTVESGGMLMCIANDVTVYLGEDGQATIEVADVDGGSGVPCAEDATKSIDRNMFFCNDVGIENPVTLTISSSLGDTSCTAMVMVLDTISPVVNCPADMTINCVDIVDDLSVFGNVNTIGSNCSVLTEDVIDTVAFNLNECGTGSIVRTFTATDINGNSSQCSQILTVQTGSSFGGENITWPADTLVIEQCISIDPDTIDSRPTVMIPDSMCTNLGFAFEDQFITSNSNCQDTVVRTWMVIDSCPDPFNVFTFEQVIIVIDEMAPMITLEDSLFLCDTLVSYEFEVADCNEISVVYTSDTTVSGMGTTIIGDFPEGNTTVRVTATDRCGNTTEDSIVFNIVLDTVPPQLMCRNRNIAIEEDGETVVLPSDGQWFFGVSDNTTDSTDLMYSFNPDFDMTNDTIVFTCDSVILKSHTLDIYVKDKGGNVSTCIVSYVTTDPNDVCPDNLNGIEGTVATESKLHVPDVRMDLINGDVYEMTDASGFYRFAGMQSEKVYELRPEKNTDHMAGVSSLDLILIQRHILNITKLASPYQLIAADINRSGKITGKDLLDLRKNILGLVNSFPNNTSWRFVDAGYSFVDASNPFSEVFPESFMVYDMNKSHKVDFIGMKVGDVNGSIQMNKLNDVVRRGAPLVFNIHDQKIDALDELLVPVKLSHNLELVGGQISFVLHPSISVVDITSELLDISVSDWSVRQEGSKTLLTLLILPQENLNVGSDETLFNIKLSSAEPMQLEDAISFNVSFDNELYDEALKIRPLSLNIIPREMISNSDMISMVNTPNPWKDKTTISFDLPSNQKATINVYTVTGALVRSISGDYIKGRNEVVLKSSDFDQNGVFYYELVTDNEKISRRMILLK